MNAHRILPLFASLALALSASPAAYAQAQEKPGELSLDQAVNRAQQETNGQVLSAESRRWDRRTEYRIKVLTPEGHVRVMTIPASSGNSVRLSSPPNRIPPTRTPPAHRAGSKERH